MLTSMGSGSERVAGGGIVDDCGLTVVNGKCKDRFPFMHPDHLNTSISEFIEFLSIEALFGGARRW
jgi:hypothetical protein